jgi:GLPGLI family protein
MKKASLLFISFLSAIVYSQENKSIGKVEYGMTFLLDNFKTELVYSNDKAVFTYSKIEEDSETTDDDIINIKKADSVPHIIYNDAREKKLYNYSCIFSLKEHDWVEEKTPNFNWVLIDETKKIGNMQCSKALCTFRGRNYTAWYSTEIKSYFGPWKFCGLPGLILEVTDNENKVSFFVKKITIPFNTPIEIKPTNTIPLEKVKQIQKEKAEDLIKTIESKQERGVSVKVKVNAVEQIEKD